MLWDKCTKDKDLYVELWPEEKKNFSDSTTILPKNNENSESFRSVGNSHFKRHNIEIALTIYNISLCLAENGSEELSKAYANRSLCFFRMKRYSNCLIDIELAKQADYPEGMTTKLDERALKCKEFLKIENAYKAEPQLSFTATEKIPAMADCFRVENDDNYGTRVIVTEDLEIGQNILIEEPCVRHMEDGPVRRCYNCYKEYMNLIPCKKCTKGMFCSETCMENGCEVNQSDNCVDQCLPETFRSVLLALKAYPNVEDLMKATEEIRSRSQLWDEVEDYLHSPSPLTTYRLFFSRGVKNSYLLKNWTAQDIQKQMLHYHHVMKNPKMAKAFSSIDSQRFLQHLILHHVLVIKGCKGILALYEHQKISRELPLSELRSQIYAVGHYPVSNMFNHSCVPNVFLITFDHRIVLKIVQAVKKGEELFLPYFTIGKRTETLKERRAQLYQLGCQLPHQQCQCNVCRNDSTLDLELPDMSIVDKFKEMLLKPIKDMTLMKAQDFIHDATVYLNENNDNHPSFNTMAAQNGLYMFWHMFPELV